ncbi:hypothetical protein QQ008_17715 [Fulvivirgaceae bacterium BMA10]|uniref:Uncharacterized protein n=1 Tax=Splendidivirga corallicola TaxID=3051826 RepID=A0ABT8KR43_9BACT|nr:hypothetical protein [Fulvivirgaceae bacterium BMA10]
MTNPEQGINLKLKLSTKKLNSGKYQVKFCVSGADEKGLYGYTLVDAGDTLKNVVRNIQDTLVDIRHSEDSYNHAHLYSLGKRKHTYANFMIFEA